MEKDIENNRRKKKLNTVQIFEIFFFFKKNSIFGVFSIILKTISNLFFKIPIDELYFILFYFFYRIASDSGFILL